MTLGKYKRLLLVVVFPLLMLGLIYSSAVKPYPFADVLCRSYNAAAEDHCWKGSEKDFMRTPVSIRGGPIADTYVTFAVLSAPTTLGRVTVDDVSPYSSMNPQAIEPMEKLKGREALIWLDSHERRQSLDTGSEIYLYCNELKFDKKEQIHIKNPGPYAAKCFGENWSGIVSFTPGTEAAERLTRLRGGLAEAVGKIERNYLIERYVPILIPILLFLLLSAVVWLTIRAMAYVRAG